MAAITPDAVCRMNGVRVYQKLIPDGTVWRSAEKAAAAGFSAGSYYKADRKLSGNTGRVQFVTIHNTGDIQSAADDAAQYTAATFGENMASSRVHFYIDENGAWQTLRAGTGLTPADPEGSAEMGWHAGDGSAKGGGNECSLSIEIIMGENAAADAKSRDNGARAAAWLLWKHGLGIDALVTHTYWVNRSAGKVFGDRDVQSTNPIFGKKWCPSYLFGSNDRVVALKNWRAFKALTESYLNALKGVPAAEPAKTVKGEYSRGTDEDAKYIWDYLMERIGNAYGAAGVLGNLYWESGLRSNNMENGYEGRLGMTDESYTAAVDNGTYTGFITDSVGYGLAQWTYWSLKRDLKAYCADRGVSVGDFKTQVEFLFVSIKEGFPALLEALRGASSVREASNAMLFNYERPADQGERIQNMRAEYGLYVYNKFAGSNPEEDEEMSYEQFKDYMKKYRAELQDNDCGEWSREAREWAVKNGLINGTGGTINGEPNYAWADSLTREQAAALFYRLAKILGKNVQ